MNLTDLNTTPLHVAFDEVCRAAANRGLRVTGTEIVGLIPKRVLLEAGRYFLNKQQRSAGISQEDIIKIAVKSLGLDDLKPFVAEEKVIETLLEDKTSSQHRLVSMTARDLAEETASESPAPGGGSISAYMGALGAALSTMVANLSAHKPGWDDQWEIFASLAEESHSIMERLLALVDEDTAAFNEIMKVFSMPKDSEEQTKLRNEAMQKATLYATRIPLQTMKVTMEIFPVLQKVAEKGNPNSISDVGVGVYASRAAVLGAKLNVEINASGLENKTLATELIQEACNMADKAEEWEKQLIEIVKSKI